MTISPLISAFSFTHALDAWCDEKRSQLSAEDNPCIFSVSKKPSALSIEVVVIAGGDRYRKASNKEDVIQLLWREALHELDELVNRYQHSKESSQNELQRRYDARRIQVFCETNSLFAEFLSEDLLHKSIAKVNTLFQEVCGAHLFDAASIDLLCGLREAYAASCVDGLTQSTCPTAALHTFLLNDLLDACEEEKIKDWIEAVSDQKFYITPLLLHRSLRFWFHDIEQLGRLITFLASRGLSLLRNEDEVWNSFVVRLHAGMRVAHDDNGDIVLGEKRKTQNFHECHIESYALEGREEKDLLVAKRPGSFLFYAQMEKHNIWGMGLPSLTPLGKSGLFAIADHIETPYTEIDWGDAKNSNYKDEKKPKILNEIIKLVAWLKEKRIRPKNFLPERIGITKGGRLVLNGPIDLDDSEKITQAWLEDFVKKGANGNICVFTEIMKGSTLGFHSTIESKRASIIHGVHQQIKEKGMPQEADPDGTISYYYSVWKRIFDEKRITASEELWNALSTSILRAIEDVLRECLISYTQWDECEHLVRARLKQSCPVGDSVQKMSPRTAVVDGYTV